MQSSVPSWFQPSSRKQAILLQILLYGAPLALAASFLLHETPGHHASFHIPLDRGKAIAAAHQTAKRVGLDARGWKEQVRVQVNSQMVDYFRRRPIPQNTRARLFAAEVGVSVLLSAPDGGLYLTVTFAADGTEVGYRIAGRDLRPAEPLGEEELLSLATIELKPLMNEMSLEGLGTPEITASEAAGLSGVRRVTYRPFAPTAPDAEFSIQLDFLGGRLIAREVKAEPSEAFTARFQRQSTSLSTFGNLFRGIVILVFSFYAALRFSRRIADREAPILRAIVLTAVIPVAGTLIYFLDPALSARELKPETFAAAGLISGLLSRMFGYLMQAIVMGTGYGGGEGSIREDFPGKLVSLDAIIRGHFFSANAGQAVITGTAIGCWLVLAYHLSATADRQSRHVVHSDQHRNRLLPFPLDHLLPQGANLCAHERISLPAGSAVDSPPALEEVDPVGRRAPSGRHPDRPLGRNPRSGFRRLLAAFGVDRRVAGGLVLPVGLHSCTGGLRRICGAFAPGGHA